MKGIFRVIVKSKKVVYDFEIRRNITIITGDSAKGKTTLVDYINSYDEYGKDSGVTVYCERPCKVIGGSSWKSQLKDIKESIVFIDEGSKFVGSVDFAHAVKSSTNYYVIISRENLKNLPYSINEIYGITESGKYKNVKQVYNKMFSLYGEYSLNNKGCKPDIIITEDEKSGFQFFEHVSREKGYMCIPAKGKANIIKYIINRGDKKVLIIVDGAAFGPEMDVVIKSIKRYRNYTLYAPESFEWTLLNAEIFKDKYIEDILSNPSEYIESSLFFSWERFFTYIIEKVSKNYKGYEYSKDNLNIGYKNKNTVSKILSSINKIDFS